VKEDLNQGKNKKGKNFTLKNPYVWWKKKKNMEENSALFQTSNYHELKGKLRNPIKR